MKRPSPQHHLMRNYSNGKVVSRIRMILPAQYLRRHISWSSACVSIVIEPVGPCNSKVSYPCIALLVKYYILRLDVAMDYSFGVEVFEP